MSSPIRRRLADDTVALISLVIAITSLRYTGWHNEQREHDRNARDRRPGLKPVTEQP